MSIRMLWQDQDVEWSGDAFGQAEKIRQEARNPRLELRLPAPVTRNESTLYDALEKFKKEIMESDGRKKSTKHAFAYQLELLKDAIPNKPILSIRRDDLYQLAQYWISRPNRRGTKQPIAVLTVEAQLLAARRFFRWLDEHDNYPFTKPSNLIGLLKRPRNLETKDEIFCRINGHDLLGDDELLQLWMYASPRRSLYMLLAMNCGFGSADIASLTFQEVNLDGERIRRFRGKSGVYCEWNYLFPETIKALQTYMKERKRLDEFAQKYITAPEMRIKADSPVILTESGSVLSHTSDRGGNCDSIGNSWNAHCRQ